MKKKGVSSCLRPSQNVGKKEQCTKKESTGGPKEGGECEGHGKNLHWSGDEWMKKWNHTQSDIPTDGLLGRPETPKEGWWNTHSRPSERLRGPQHVKKKGGIFETCAGKSAEQTQRKTGRSLRG